jgi:hypothetical protein
MADNLELDVETLGKTLKDKASRFRQLASGILDGDFRRRLLDLAWDYDVQAATLQRKIPHGM